MPNYKVGLKVILFVALTACTKKQQYAPLSDYVPQDPPGKCDCSAASPEYVRADFNHLNICFNSVTNVTDTFANAYYSDSSEHVDHINLIRDNIDKTMACQLHFINPDLHDKTLPYVLPHASPDYNEYAEIILTNLSEVSSQNSSDNYIGNTYQGFKIIITDTSGGYLKGTFSGAATTKSGKQVTIDNGVFNVHVISVGKSH